MWRLGDNKKTDQGVTLCNQLTFWSSDTSSASATVNHRAERRGSRQPVPLERSSSRFGGCHPHHYPLVQHQLKQQTQVYVHMNLLMQQLLTATSGGGGNMFCKNSLWYPASAQIWEMTTCLPFSVQLDSANVTDHLLQAEDLWVWVFWEWTTV